MSDPRSPHEKNGATPWPEPGQQGPPYPEQLGSPAHPQSPYAEPQYPDQHTGQYAVATGGPPVATGQQHQVPVGEAYPPARRRLPRKPLPEPPAGLAVGAIVAACCLLFVELAELAILLVTGGRGGAVAGIEIGLGFRFDPNGDTVSLLFGLAAFAAAGVWLQASRSFAEAANPVARFTHGRVWTWFGWWVPVVFLWVPYGVVRDVRRALVPNGGHRVALGLWWSFWLLSGLRVLASSSADAEIIVRSVAVAALTVAFGWWVRIIREITRAQEKAAGFA
ncbi:DUF4328 domain-containing protein [Promicromonospora vindobonensis]|uniref:DUF4328 domain-containing protein n=1 Tax=Promicromonospora vindobonensis TaxID=195748 RepID=A0ABW5VWX3_9MICO